MKNANPQVVRKLWPLACGLIVGGLLGGITQSWSVGALFGGIAAVYFRWQLIPGGINARNTAPSETANDALFEGGPYLYPQPNTGDPLEHIAAMQRRDQEVDLGYGFGAWPKD